MARSFLVSLLLKSIWFVLGISLLSGALLSCVKEVPSAHIPTLDQQPVVFGFISPQDTVLMVKVSWSRPGLNQLSLQTINQPIPDALVSLTGETGSLVFQYSPTDSLYLAHPYSMRIEAGKTYQLSVRLASGQQIESTCTVPLPVPIQAVDIDSARGILGQGYDYYVQSRWQDPVGVANYYRFAGQQTYNALINDPSGTPPQERQMTASLDFGSVFGTNLLTDAGTDGQLLISTRGNYTRYYTYVPTGSSSDSANSVTQRTHGLKLTIWLLNVEKSYYDYHKALALYALNEGNPFAEPVLVPTNIEGGLGCFSAFNRSAQSVDIR